MNKITLALALACIVAIPVAYAQDLPSMETAEKVNRVMDYRLAELYGSTTAGGVPERSFSALSVSPDGQSIQVVLVMDDVDAPVPQDLGITVEVSYDNLVQATVPIANLEAIASDENVTFVRVPAMAAPSANPLPLSHDRRGHVISEGANEIYASSLNSAGHTGDGIRIAVIDAGFDIKNSEIASSIAGYRSFILGVENRGDISNGGDNAHGTGVSEIIVDVAPDARLYLYNIKTDVEFFSLVDHLIGRGDIDIISMSLGWYNDAGPADGTSGIAKKVNEARDRGILWINAAGNEAQQHWQGTFADPDSDGWHNFDGDDQTLQVSVREGEEFEAILSWDDWDSPSQDYDLYLVDYRGNVITKSENRQPGSGPFETVSYIPEADVPVEIQIKKVSATRDVTFQLYSLPPYRLGEYRIEASSITIPADARGAVAVGAFHWKTDELEFYSSRGPTLDGRIKPDITAPTRVSTSAYGPERFAGTSSATPHVAGAAALLMSKYPDATADQVQILLESTVKSRHAKSNQDGTGRLDLSMFTNSRDIIAVDNSNPTCVSTGTCFFPSEITVQVGRSVYWINADTERVQVTGPNFDRTLDRGNTHSEYFGTAGTFAYSDPLHPWATGRITVGTGTPLNLVSAAYDRTSGIITMTFSEPISSGSFYDERFDIRERGQDTGGVNLGDSRGHTAASPSILTFELNGRDRNAVNAMAAPQIDMSFGAVRGSGQEINTVTDLPISVIGLPATTRTVTVASGAGMPGCEGTASGCYSPKTTRLAVGGTVTFSNADAATHTFTSGTSAGGHNGIFDSGHMPAGESYTYEAKRVGVFPYYCTIHPWMAGEIIVVDERSGGNSFELLNSAVAALQQQASDFVAFMESWRTTLAGIESRLVALEQRAGIDPPEPGPTTGVRGKVYTDINGNGMLDSGEPGVPDRIVLVVSLSNHADVNRLTTNANGNYSAELRPGGYLVQIEGGGPQGFAYIDVREGSVRVLNLIP